MQFQICRFATFTDMMATSQKLITVRAFSYLDRANYSIKVHCIYTPALLLYPGLYIYERPERTKDFLVHRFLFARGQVDI